MLPCRPAAPDIRVSYIKSPPPPAASQVKVTSLPLLAILQEDLHLAFHPHLGFVSPSASTHHSGFYTCTFKGQGRAEEQMVQMHVTRKFHSVFISFVIHSLLNMNESNYKKKLVFLLVLVKEANILAVPMSI